MNLSGRELQIAGLISQGYFEKEIADRLCLSFATIHTYTRRIRQKLDAGNIAQITRKYIILYDKSVKRRIANAFDKGRRHGIIESWINKAANQPERGFPAIRQKTNYPAPAKGRTESDQTGTRDLLSALGIGNTNQYQCIMKVKNDNELMQKIDRLMWLNVNCSKEDLDKLIEITKELKNLETAQNENSKSGN